MKLITELVEEVSIQEVFKDDGSKDFYIEGVYMQAGVKNRNGRLYPASVLENEVNKYVTEKVNTNGAYGELGHPQGPTINLERASHRIVSLRKEGNDFIGKAKVMDTPMGQIVKTIMNEGGRLGVSSRGMGSLKEVNGIDEVQDDFRLATAADIVSDPSAPKAFVNGIMENVEWIYDASTNQWAEQVIDSAKKIGKRNAAQLEEQGLYLLESWLNSLK